MTKFSELPAASRGWCLDGLGRGVAVMSFVYLSSGILEISEQVADENGKIEGTNIHSTTIITLMTTLNNFATTVMLPIAGAIIDHTPYRWQISYYSVLFLICGNIFQTFVFGPEVFWVIVALQFFGNWGFMAHSITTLAYLPELTDDVNLRGEL